jgi:hypothetical protein
LETKKFSVDADGWVPLALAAVTAGQSFSISITGEAVAHVMRRIQDAVAAFPLLALWKDVKALVPLAGKLPFDPTMVVPVLAAIGGAGGAAGAAAFVASAGFVHGMEVTLEYVPHALFSVVDDEFLFNLRAKV